MNDLLLEIGTEEIPAGYIAPALKSLSETLLKKLDDAGIEHGGVRTFGTPRRLAVEVKSVSDRQPSKTTEFMGPPKRVGFDENGQPTIAAVKFAEKAGVPVTSLQVRETDKGVYLYANKTERGVATKTFLKTILPEVILSTAFPKTMRWADLSISFARPIQSILALLGKSVVSFSLGNLKSGGYTFGHRFLHPSKIKITSPENYTQALESAYVIPALEERKEAVLKEVTNVAKSLGGSILPDPELVDIVTNLVEFPVAVAGSFDHKFLELPQEVLITAMREHQKYFAVKDQTGKLMPCFIAVNNTRAKDMGLVAKGHERVLRARLEDARFFYQSDIGTPLESRVEKLKGILFQAKLGSVFEKTMRVQKLGEFLVDEIGGDSGLKPIVSRAAWLCKADLVTQVVVEFPKLQGIMGRVYATLKNEPIPVASAIEEHYRPTASGGVLPETLTGALVAIADKIDSICGCFHAGLIPTGASDPYALRRQGIGIIQIMLDKRFMFSLRELIRKSLSLFSAGENNDTGALLEEVFSFLQSRMSHLLVEEGFSKDVVAAVLSVSSDQVPDAWRGVRALEALKKRPDFEPLAIAFKRVVNIVKKAGITDAVQIDESRFIHESESALFAAYKEIKAKVAESLQGGSVEQALLDIATLRPPVDAFFDGVLVMTDDEAVRVNRLALLKHIGDLFGNIADFSKISA